MPTPLASNMKKSHGPARALTKRVRPRRAQGATAFAAGLPRENESRRALNRRKRSTEMHSAIPDAAPEPTRGPSAPTRAEPPPPPWPRVATPRRRTRRSARHMNVPCAGPTGRGPAAAAAILWAFIPKSPPRLDGPGPGLPLSRVLSWGASAGARDGGWRISAGKWRCWDSTGHDGNLKAMLWALELFLHGSRNSSNSFPEPRSRVSPRWASATSP